MKDRYSRSVDYIRISVTDLCNLRCFYCMPEEGICKKGHGEVLRYEEIVRVVEEGVNLGIKKIRITGGEPLVRLNIEELIYKINEIDGIEDISMTTNGLLLKDKVKSLKEAGLKRVNISLDSLRSDKYSEITRGGDLNRVLQAINLCLEEGLKPVKINNVLLKGINDDEIEEFALLTKVLPISVRFIELMPIGQAANWFKDHYMPLDEAVEKLPGLVPNKEDKGSGPAKNYKFPGALGTVGFIGALSHNFCSSCNRIRLTADGKIKPCLNSSLEVDLKPALREGKGNLREVLGCAIGLKPEKHNMEEGRYREEDRSMYQIGG